MEALPSEKQRNRGDQLSSSASCHAGVFLERRGRKRQDETKRPVGKPEEVRYPLLSLQLLWTSVWETLFCPAKERDKMLRHTSPVARWERLFTCTPKRVSLVRYRLRKSQGGPDHEILVAIALLRDRSG